MKIAFWSSESEKTGVTSNLAGLSIMLSMMFQCKVLLFENHYHDNNLEKAFTNRQYNNFVREEDYFYNHIGIDNLMKQIHSGIKGAKTVEETTVDYLNGNIYYIPHSSWLNRDIFEYELNQVIRPLLSELEKFCDFVFVDAASCNQLSTKVILEEADIVIVNINQDKNLLKHFFVRYSSLQSKSIFVIGKYNQKSFYNKHAIANYFHIEPERIGTVPYNIEFGEALSGGTVIEFLSRNFHCKRGNTNYFLIRELKKTAVMIYQTINLRKGE